MNFRGHVVGGTVVGFSMSAMVIATSPANVFAAGIAFLSTILMSLFPDLDVASVSQRWFYRVIFVLLIALYLTDQMEGFVILTFLSFLPLIDKHRGWTHSPFVPMVLIGLVITALWNGERGILDWIHSQSELPDNHFIPNWIIPSSILAGHFTHLLLDSRLLANRS